MQSWSRQSTKCLFCQFRQSISHPRLRPDTRLHTFRDFTSSSIRYDNKRSGKRTIRISHDNDKSTEQNSRNRKERKVDTTDRAFRGKEHDFSIRRTNRRRTEEDDPEEKRALIQKHVREGLNKVKERLSKQEPSQGDESTLR